MLLFFSDPNVPTVPRITKLGGFNDVPYLIASKNTDAWRESNSESQ